MAAIRADLWTDPGREATIASVTRPAFHERPIPVTIEPRDRVRVVVESLESTRSLAPGIDGAPGARGVVDRPPAPALGPERVA